MSTVRTRFPGAQPFADDALSRSLFFGRDKESLALRNQVLANRLTVLFARSGLGKTSLINAGFSRGLLEDGIVALVVRVNDPVAGALASVYGGIARQCLSHGIEHVPGRADSLWHYFKTAQFWHDEQLLTPVLVLDQFEEIFTLQSPEAREAFVGELSALVRGVRPAPAADQAAGLAEASISDAPPRLHVLISIREDFLANLEDFADRIPGILGERFRLLPLDRSQAQHALDEPTRVDSANLVTQPFTIADDCRAAILDFLEQRSAATARRSAFAIEPFQLQLLCQHIEDVARMLQVAAPGRPCVVGLHDIGGARRLELILRQFYHRQLADLPLMQRVKAARLCAEHLVTPQGRRVRMEETEIHRLCRVRPQTLQLLVDRRVIRRDQTADGDYYELSHDSLIKPVVDARRFAFIARLVVTPFKVIGLLLSAGVVLVALLTILEKEFGTFEVLVFSGLAAVILMLLLAAGGVIREAAENFRRSRL